MILETIIAIIVFILVSLFIFQYVNIEKFKGDGNGYIKCMCLTRKAYDPKRTCYSIPGVNNLPHSSSVPKPFLNF